MVEPLTFEQLRELISMIGGGIIFIVFILALFTDFWDNIFKRK